MPREQKTREAEYEDFARRMIDDIEELDYTLTRTDWLEFTNSKMYRTTGRTMTDAQLARMDVERLGVADIWSELGIRRDTPFISRPGVVRYRDLEGTFVSKGAFISKYTLTAAIQEVRLGRSLVPVPIIR